MFANLYKGADNIHPSIHRRPLCLPFLLKKTQVVYFKRFWIEAQIRGIHGPQTVGVNCFPISLVSQQVDARLRTPSLRTAFVCKICFTDIALWTSCEIEFRYVLTRRLISLQHQFLQSTIITRVLPSASIIC